MADQKFNVNCGFFDSINDDRLYSAELMNKPYERIITEGVFATQQGTPSTDLQVISASSGMNIIVKKGQGLFGKKWFENSADIAITVPSNTDVVPRRDSVIVQVDKRQSGRNGSIIYRTGTPSSNPQVPPIGTIENVIEYRIANIYVATGATAINQDAIVDLRGSSECPWITSLIEQVDTSTLFLQFETAYWNWYNNTHASWEEFMKEISQDLKVNTNLVKYESHYISSSDGETEIPINIENYDKSKDVLIVRINHLFATEGTDYSISSDSSKITLTKDIYANQNIDFLVLQSVVVGDTATVLQELQTLSTAITNLNSDSGWINFTLENGTAFDDTTKPAIRKFGNQVYIRGAIKGLDTLNVPICTLPTNMRPAMNKQYSVSAFSNGSIVANCVLEIRSTGSIYLVAKSGTISSTAMLPIATEFILD